MRRIVCTFLLALCSLFLMTAGMQAGDSLQREEKPAEENELSLEDRQVIRMLELLQRMELLQDMEILEGETKVDPEDKQ